MATWGDHPDRTPTRIWHVSPSLTTVFIAAMISSSDSFALLVIMIAVRRRGLVNAVGVPSFLDKIVQDVTLYFPTIFSFHTILVLFGWFAPVSILA